MRTDREAQGNAEGSWERQGFPTTQKILRKRYCVPPCPKVEGHMSSATRSLVTA